ncbi:hypothetical protein B7P43_G05278 [Cryptotermes secundus]|uniref:Tc1-like transposase DDE domain-containing protein n=1 Tax=Cryptotermes secundus TaxID=105785 RepID=A0A2J7PZV2_9NEOP|nr:hypothetical protein B7P43_G05278 [Cryptotermes secundus]
MSFRQGAVIELLAKEEIPAAEIHQRLQRAYGSVCMGASSVRKWVKHFKDGNTSIEDESRSGRPQTASVERNKERVDEIIQDDRRMTVDTVARKLGIGHSVVQEMIESLAYRKVCARWVPRKNWLLLHDNAHAHRSVPVQEELSRQQVAVLPHPPYSPDLAPCDFFLFHRMKAKLRGRRFQSSEEVVNATRDAVWEFPVNMFQQCFRQL